MTDTIFGADAPVLGDLSDGTNYTMGTYFTVDTAGSADCRWFAPTSGPNGTLLPVKVQLWDVAANTIIATGTMPTPLVLGAWNAATMSAHSLTTGKTYCMSVVTNQYTATVGYFSSSKVSGHLTGTAGHFHDITTSTTPVLPDGGSGTSGYFVDAVFTASGGGSDLPVSGTLSGTGTITGTVTGNRTAAGALAGTGTPSGAASGNRVATGALQGHGTPSGSASGGDGGIPQDGAAYEIEAIMDALAALFNGVPTGDTINGQPITLECHAEVVGQVDPPSLVLELDDLNWDLNMGHGADGFTIVALALVTYQDMDNSQRALWRFLSRKESSGVLRLKAALEADQTLGGLVSYAIMTTVRDIGNVTYNGADYLGAELIIEVIS